MRIGIIGATGFIGGALAAAASARGHVVVAFSRRREVSLPMVQEVRNVAPAGPAIDVSGLDAIVNLAGESVLGLWTGSKRARILGSRVALTERVVEALRGCPSAPRVFVSASGTGFYGDRGDEVLTEASARGVGFLADVCAEWEAAAAQAAALGVRVVTLRTGMVLGAGGGAWPVLRRIFRAGLGGRLGGGRQWVPWIHLEDEVGIILQALEDAAVEGPLNLAAPGIATNAELTRALARALRRPAVLPAPAPALRLFLGGMSDLLLHSQRALPEAVLRRGYGFRHPDLSGALAALAASGRA